MLTVAEAAARAAVCETIIRSWVADGTLPHFRLGKKGSRGKIVIAVEDLDGVLAAFKVGAKKPVAKSPPPSPLKHVRI